ncbi:MAG: carbamate kinase [Eubacterium sp.]|nr:carbamate kinase [Eubacterium sp.]
MQKKRMVIALGHKDLGFNLPEQYRAVQKTAKLIVEFVRKGYQIAIVFSNAPQVGMIHTAMSDLARHYPAQYTKTPLAVCSAMSQGLIGYDLQNALQAELAANGISRTVSTILTQVQADPYDEQFYAPSKKVGKQMSREEAEAEEQNGNQTAEIRPGVFMRVVPSPVPQSIIEIDAIRALLNQDQIVLACGGGGIPVIRQGTCLRGAAAVIEKDLAAGLLAREVNADLLLITTAVEQVSLHFGKPDARAIPQMTADEARQYIGEGHFEFRSMLPKVQAAVDFVEAGIGRRAIITTMEQAVRAEAGEAGTTIEDRKGENHGKVYDR